MHAILEYLAIGILIILFISISISIIYNVTGHLVTVKEEQLYNVAERLMDKILLTPGYPPDWGANFTSDLSDFGLALNGTRTPYVVDPDKVMRLANLSVIPNPLLINSSRIADLLGIKDDYGFRLEMKPLLSANIEPLSFYDIPGQDVSDIPILYEVNVTNWYDIGVPNANVTGMLVIMKIKPNELGNLEEAQKKVFVVYNYTDALGRCILDFRVYESAINNFIGNRGNGRGSGAVHWIYHFLIIHINWKGFVSVHGYSALYRVDTHHGHVGKTILTGYIIGNYIFINKTITTPGNGGGAILTKDEVVEAIPEYQSLLTVTDVEWLSQNQPPPWPGLTRPWERYRVGKIKYIEKLSSHVFLPAMWEGVPVVVVFSRIPSIDISYGTSAAMPANSVTITRVAHIYNYPYLVKLTVWRKAEG